MKSTAEAVYLRNTLLLNFEKAVTIEKMEKLKQILNIVVVEGGPTGIEICGALAEMKKFVLPKDYPHIDFNLMQITLIEANLHLFVTFDQTLQLILRPSQKAKIRPG